MEVLEDQTPDYQVLNTASNPAHATVVGSISPWYEEEPKSLTLGRLLIPAKPFKDHFTLAAMIAQVDEKRNRILLDFLCNVPEIKLPESKSGRFLHGKHHQYQTYDLGKLQLTLVDPSGKAQVLGEQFMDSAHFSREQFLNFGGILEYELSVSHTELREGSLCLDLVQENGESIRLLSESEFMIASDEAALYANVGDTPGEGYTVDGAEKVVCQLRVFQKGVPRIEPMKVYILECKVTDCGAKEQLGRYTKYEEVWDKMVLEFPTGEACNSLYLFRESISVIGLNYQVELFKNPSFISLRVLPKQEYGKYLDPNHPDYTTPIPFEVVYREVLQSYELIYPSSALITPFTEAYFKKFGGFIQKLTGKDFWDKFLYMPSTRDMSENQVALLSTWVEQQKEVQE